MYEALRKGATVEKLYKLTYIKPYFIQQMKELVELKNRSSHTGGKLPDNLLIRAKKTASPTATWPQLLGVPETHPRMAQETRRRRRLAPGTRQ